VENKSFHRHTGEGDSKEMTASTAVAPGGSAKRHPLQLFPFQGTDLE
jgi:hypothetical protein